MSFVPISTLQGSSITELGKEFKRVFIWGAGVKGKQIKRFITRNLGDRITCTLIDDQNKTSGMDTPYPSITPVDLYEYDLDSQSVVLFNDKHSLSLAFSNNPWLNQVSDKSTIKLFRDYSRPESVIELTNDFFFLEKKNGQIDTMSFDLFVAIFDKLKKEIPHLFCLDLSGWANPLSNPDLGNILDCIDDDLNISITIGIEKHLEKLDYLRKLKVGVIVVQPMIEPKDLSENDFDYFRYSLEKLSCLNQVQSGFVDIRVSLHRFASNSRDLIELRKICQEIQVRYVESEGYVNPYDKLYSLSEQSYPERKFEDHNLTWDLNKYLKLAFEFRSKPCLCQRIFPVISHKGQVRNCHLYTDFVLESDFLSVDYDSLIEGRKDNSSCRLCQMKGLHRLDIELLRKMDL